MTRRWLVVLVSLVPGARVASAQPTATSVLADVQKYYGNAKTLSAKFRQTVTHQAFGNTQVSQGDLYAAKPTQFRFEYTKVAKGVAKRDKTFVYDGTSLWWIDHASMQYRMQPMSATALPSALLFVTNPGALGQTFNVALADPTTLSLTPKQVSAQYKEIRLTVAPDGHVKETKIFDGNGDTERIELFQPSLTAAGPGFTVTPASLQGYKKMP